MYTPSEIGENCENGLGLWLGCRVYTSSENGEKIFEVVAVVGCVTPVKMVKMVKW